MVGNIVKQLVLEGKRVIIPNFGAFLIRDAAIVPILTPDNVTFSPFLRYNDGFLEKELVQRSTVHKDEANAAVAAFADQIIAAINTQGKYCIDGLGYFYKDAKNSICFSIHDPLAKADESASVGNAEKESEPIVDPMPDIKSLFNNVIDREPLGNVAADKVDASSTHKVKVEKSNAEIRHTTRAEAKQDVKTDTVVSEPPKTAKTEKKPAAHTATVKTPRKRRFGLLLWSIGVIAVLLVLNVFWNDIFGTDPDSKRPKIVLEPIEEAVVAEQGAAVSKAEEKVAKDNQLQDEIDKQISSTLKDKSAQDKSDKVKPATSTDKKKDKEKESAPVKKKEEPSKSAAKVEVSNSYVLVLGSFGTEANARKRLQELSAKNISAKVVERNNMHSIIFGNFKDYDKAQKEQSRLKGLGIDGWISRR